MSPRLRAALVHVLTASGAVLALFALRAAHAGDWQTMFAWLGLALIVDAIDGPLARRFDVVAVLPRFSGERLDLIVDYLTYVAIPAYVLTETDLLPAEFRVPAAIAILLSSLFHVADTGSKTEEGYFVGFPAVWNIVLLYLFAFRPQPFVALAIVATLVLATFIPILSLHPLRVRRLRLLSILATVVWAVAAVAALAFPFPSPLWVQGLLLLTAVYFACIGLLRSVASAKSL
jgi:phosphatidylcholine synthase